MNVEVNLTGWIDYDRHLLPALSPAERVSYFEKRVRLVLLNPVDHLLNHSDEAIGRKDSSALLMVGVSICCAIEATGRFFKGNLASTPRNKNFFNAFLYNYMDKRFQLMSLGEKSYGDIVWKHFRNGIAHGFVVSHGGFEDNAGDYFGEKTICGHKALVLNPFRFFNDFRQGFEKYLADLRNPSHSMSTLQNNFQKAFEEVFIQGQ